MKILRKWFLKWMQKAQQEHNKAMEGSQPEEAMKAGQYGLASGSSMNYATTKEDVPQRLNFNVMPASGGVVISINNYDRKSGRHTENLHVIHDDEDIATNIGHIVSMELLKS